MTNVSKAQSRFLSQFKSKQGVLDWVYAIMYPFDDSESAITDLSTKHNDFQQAKGYFLDTLAARIGVSRLVEVYTNDFFGYEGDSTNYPYSDKNDLTLLGGVYLDNNVSPLVTRELDDENLRLFVLLRAYKITLKNGVTTEDLIYAIKNLLQIDSFTVEQNNTITFSVKDTG